MPLRVQEAFAPRELELTITAGLEAGPPTFEVCVQVGQVLGEHGTHVTSDLHPKKGFD
jgi:hypothetical protein